MGNNESRQPIHPSAVMDSIRVREPRLKQSESIVQNQSKNVIAAIDFGTTYSGYAYSFRKEYERDPLAMYLNEWVPGKGVSKAPTTVLFTPEKKFHSFGYKAEDEYAKQSQRKTNHNWYCFRRFKMQLHDQLILKKEFVLTDETGKDMQAICIFSEAIKYLKEDLLQTIEKRNPGFTESDIFWVLTIPAIWSESAKQFMIEAAKRAGIHRGQLNLCLEPEAAALFCKTLPGNSLYGSKDNEVLKCFKPGGRYMILDLGGGTVDTAVHEVSSDGSLIEVEKSSGGAWGGCKVDEVFYKYITDKYGEDSIAGLKKMSPRDWLDLVNEFEMQKRKMTCDEETDLRLKLPTRLLLNSSMTVENQTIEHLYVRYNDFVTFFDPPTEKIEKHIKEILSRVGDIALILMVGGFAESEYVRQTLIKRFKKQRIIVPHDSSVSVLKGAILYGFNPTTISARVCRFTYGIRVNRPFEEGVHPLENKEVLDGDTICRNIFKVLVKEGEIIAINKFVEHEVCSTHRDEARRHIDMMIPVFVSINKDPLYTTDEGCKMLCKVVIHAPKEGWLVKVKYRLVMEFGRTEFRICVKNDFNNQEYAVSCDFLT